ncbi:cysteine peptidase family C39 domain-containing protein [Phnomibacter sp. MR]|uniref:cysteine peptidase family C39 domain-containing protein n=1 Tax=Phnomibacter sp. MR TaxID=3042318 RepID=UPI003A80FEFA
MPFPHYRQLDAMDCGPTCLRMVARHYGRSVSLEYLRSKSEYGKQGASILGLTNKFCRSSALPKSPGSTLWLYHSQCPAAPHPVWPNYRGKHLF